MTIFLFVFLGIYLLIYVQQPPSESTMGQRRPISVIIPFYNEAKRLPILARSIADFGSEVCEYIFVDDGSTDDSENVLKSVLSNGNGNYKILKTSRLGKAGAIHEAIAEVSHERVMVLDADCRLSSSTLNAIAHGDDSTEVQILPVSVEPVRGQYSDFQQLEYLAMNATSIIFSKSDIPLLISSAAIVMPVGIWRDFFSAKGVPRNALDARLSDYLAENEVSIDVAVGENATVFTAGAESFTSFIQQRSKWGADALYNYRLILLFALIYAVNVGVIIGVLSGVLGWMYIGIKWAVDVYFFGKWQKLYGLEFSVFARLKNAMLYTPYILLSPLYAILKKN